MSAEVMDPQERGDRIMCEIDALTKLDTSTFPLPGFTTKDREPNCQMGSNRFSRAGMALYEYQKHRGLLESQKKEQSERTGESRTDNSPNDGSQQPRKPRNAEAGTHASPRVRPFPHRSQSTYSRDARGRVSEMRSAQFHCARPTRSRRYFDDKITVRNLAPDHARVRSSMPKPASSAAYESRHRPSTNPSAMLSKQTPEERSATAKSSSYNPYDNWGTGTSPPLSFDWFGPRTPSTDSQPPTSYSPDPTSAASYFDQEAVESVSEKGLAAEVSANSDNSHIEASVRSPALSSRIQSTTTESAASTSDDGHISHASAAHANFSDISHHLLQPLPERSDPYRQRRAFHDSVENRSRSASKFMCYTTLGHPRDNKVTSTTFKAYHRKYPPPMPYNPYLARNASEGRFATSRYHCRGANANESQQRSAARYPKSIRFAGEMPSFVHGPTAMSQGPVLTLPSNSFNCAQRPRAIPKLAQIANAGFNYRHMGSKTTSPQGSSEQSLSFFRASTPPCLKKAPLHAPKEHYALAAIKASELNRQASEKSGDEDSDIVIVDESENGDVDLRMMKTGVELGSGALQTRGNNENEKMTPTRWESGRSALAQASTNRKRGHEHLDEVYLSSDDEKAKASSQPTGWKGTYVRHPPKYAKNALRHKLEAQRPSRMTLLFEKQNGLTDEALLEDANLHLQTMLESAHSLDPSVQKIHNEEMQALKHALKFLQLRIDSNTSDRRTQIERLGLKWNKVLQSLQEWFENESRIRMDIEMQLLLRRLSDFFGRHPENCFSSDNRQNAQKPHAAGAGVADR